MKNKKFKTHNKFSKKVFRGRVTYKGTVGSIRAQLKIQEMAFMLVAVVFFFILVGLFALSIVYTNLYKQANKIAEDKTLSALISLADTPELACATSKSNCVDADKLISLVQNENYKKFWPFTTIKVIRQSAFKKSEKDMIECTLANYHSCTFSSPESTQISSIVCQKERFPITLLPTKGPFEHLSPSGTAQPPLLAGIVRPGEEIKIADVQGVVNYQGGSVINCRKKSADPSYGQVKGAFYHPTENIRYAEYDLIDFEQGILAPIENGIESYRVFFYIREYGEFINWYHDNTGSCYFNILGDKNCINSTSTTSLESECNPICERFTIYDKEVENQRIISTYVALCRKEYKNTYSYERCEIAKLIAGTEIKVQGGTTW